MPVTSYSVGSDVHTAGAVFTSPNETVACKQHFCLQEDSCPNSPAADSGASSAKTPSVQTALNHPAARPSGLPLPWGNPPPWSPHHPHCLPLPPPLPSRTAGCRTHLAGPGGLYVTSSFKASCRRTPGTARAPRAPTRTPAGPVPTHLLCGSCNDIPFGESQGPCLEPPTWLFFVALLPPLTNLLSLFFKTLSS